jgi:hypothetical protein
MDPLIEIGQPAPDFELPALDGSLHRLAGLCGRIVILNFWSCECPWVERADLALLAARPAWGEKVTWWSIAANANEPVAQLARISAARGLPLVLRDARQQVAVLYGAQTTPHLFVVDASGLLCYQGALDDVTFRKRTSERFYLRQAVEALLVGGQPDPAQTSPYGCSIVQFAD